MTDPAIFGASSGTRNSLVLSYKRSALVCMRRFCQRQAAVLVFSVSRITLAALKPLAISEMTRAGQTCSCELFRQAFQTSLLRQAQSINCMGDAGLLRTCRVNHDTSTKKDCSIALSVDNS